MKLNFLKQSLVMTLISSYPATTSAKCATAYTEHKP